MNKISNLTITLVLLCGCSNEIHNTPTDIMLQLNEPKLERWLTFILSTPKTAFRQIETLSPLFFENFQQSKGMLGLFLNEAVDPYQSGAPARWAALAAPPGGLDLLRCEYATAGLRLVLTEGVNFALVQVSDADASFTQAVDKRAYVARLLRTVVKADSREHTWRFDLPVDLNATWNNRLISSQGAPPLNNLQGRHDRADILIWKDSVHFVFYKRIEQLEDFLPDDQWFIGEARATLRPPPKTP